MLSQVEIKLLLDIYDMDINNGARLHDREYDLKDKDTMDSKYEFASYLLKLERLEYIQLDKGAILTGGMQNHKYRNNVIMYFDEKIHIKDKGIKFVQEIQKTVLDKAKEEVKDITSNIYKEVKDFATKAIAEYFIKLTTNK